MEKQLENHGKDIYISLGKTKNGKNQLQKTGQTREKIGKTKCRCVRECRFGGSFFSFMGKEKE